MFAYHTVNKIKIAELVPGSARISSPEDMLDTMADAAYNEASAIIIYEESLPEGFFDLKTKLAGEILQKFSNYRIKLSIVGDFAIIDSKSLRDFIRESNRKGVITFVGSLQEAISRLSSKV